MQGIAVQTLLTILNKWTLTQFSFHHGVYSYPHLFPDTISTYKSTPSVMEVIRQLWIKMNLNFCLFEICWSHLGDIRSYGGRLGVIQDSLGHFRAVGSNQVQTEALTLIR